ncbi:MAG: hypothetical protein ACWGIK_11070 [Achromobacter pulmonis]
MAVPSKDDFDLAIKGFENIKSMKYPGHVSEEMFLPTGSAKTATRFIRECLSAQGSGLKELNTLPAVRWLAEDRFVNRAFEAATKPVRNWLTENAAASEIYLYVAREVRYHHGLYGPSKRHMYRHPLDDDAIKAEILTHVWDCRPYVLRWSLAVLPAYYEYFHRPDAVDEFIAQEKRIDDLAKQAMAGVAPLLELARIAGRRGSKFVDEERAQLRINQLTHFVERSRSEAKRGAVPIARRDRTARERLLLWRLWSALRDEVGVTRPTTIKNLLRVEGVENEMDDRSVDAAIKKYSEQRAARDKRIRERWREWNL